MAEESPTSEASQTASNPPELKVTTDLPQADEGTIDSDDPPQSVIHAPTGFTHFEHDTTPSPSQESDITVKSPMDDATSPAPKVSPVAPPAISTNVRHDLVDKATPRAQTMQEAEEYRRESAQLRLSSSRSLEDIPEAHEREHNLDDQSDDWDGSSHQTIHDTKADDEVAALKTALGECWTLCNTLAALSSLHRERLFNFTGRGATQEQAWKRCWQLCQKLYDSRDEDYSSQIMPTLDLCREFCQALFEVRRPDNEVTDSVLRVSFELNNHLYNTHDRSLPVAFRERTLDFYITLCHRLMKQRTQLAEETDSLLRACWSLAEMLFSIRQNQREGKQADEELLGSAVQACWELCDLFREGWTQIRPERGTPRPSQMTFAMAYNQAKQYDMSQSQDDSEEDEEEDDDVRRFNYFENLNPETPTTIFEDMTISPDDEDQGPNILVLGPETTNLPHRSWTPNAASIRSGYSRSSKASSSTATAAGTPRAIHQPNHHHHHHQEDPNLTALKLLILKAAQTAGFQYPSSTSSPPPASATTSSTSSPPTSSSSSNSSLSFSSFVRALPSNSFGSLPWQLKLLENYKKLVLTDPTFRGDVSTWRGANPNSTKGVGVGVASMGPPGQRTMSAGEVSRAISCMGRTGQFGWLADLFRLVFGFRVEDVAGGGGGGGGGAGRASTVISV
ncbi:MAG: hypothetical protein M1819_000659 [Sarea resinae]|nr:MAG: hypothetical protein M1819_000659 [Sarea resinae]